MESSPWAPLRHRVFAALWAGVLISGMGTWMQTLGAQWLLVNTPDSDAVRAAADRIQIIGARYPEAQDRMTNRDAPPPSA
jgi:Transmembrane secretion effector